MLQHGVNTALSLQEGTGRDALQAGGCLRQCHRRPGAMAPALCFAALQDSLAALHVETPLHVETGELQRTVDQEGQLMLGLADLSCRCAASWG